LAERKDIMVMSNFAVVECPDLLRIAFGDTLATPEQSFDELEAGGPCGQKLPRLD
jgi:hypothetical protein